MDFNVSRLKLDMACPTKQALAYAMPIFPDHPPGMKRKSDVKAAAVFGSAYHLVLELIVKGASHEYALEEGVRYLNEAADAARADGIVWAADRILYGTGGPSYACKGCGGAGKRECKVCMGTGLTKKSAVHAVCEGQGFLMCGLCEGAGHYKRVGTEGVEYLAKAVNKYLEIDALNPTRFDEVLKVEEILRLDLGNGHRLVGRVDVAGRQNGRLWHLNHKTLYSSGKVANEIRKYEMDPHEIAYWLMLESKYGEMVAGSWIDFLVKKTEPEAIRMSVARSDKMVETTLAWFRKKTTELAAFTPADIDTLERRTINCVQYGYTCPFMEYCQGSMGLDPEEVEMMGFVPREEDYVDIGGEEVE